MKKSGFKIWTTGKFIWSGIAISAAIIAGTIAYGVFIRQKTPFVPENVIFIIVDTLRADALGTYGNSRDTSPILDEYARDNVVFDNAWAQGTYTRSSFLSYMTSSYVRSLGWDYVVPGENPPKGAFCERDDLVTLAEVFKKNGFRNTAVLGNTFLFPKHGFPRGFHQWNRIPVEEMAGQHLPRWGMKKLVDNDVVNLSIKEIRKWKPGQKNFLYVHLMDPHLPHSPDAEARTQMELPPNPRMIRDSDAKRMAEEGSDADKAMAKEFYYASVYMADKSVGRILAALKEAGVSGNTLTVISADHGEQLFEHGEFNHNAGVWAQLAHVPLLIGGDGIEHDRVERPVELIDIAPTILGFFDIEPPPQWQGEDLFESDRHRNVTERLGWTSITTDGRYKAILDDKGEWRLYDLESDPFEQKPIRNDNILADIKTTYDVWRKSTPKREMKAGDPPKGICSSKSSEGDNDELMKQLEALGYVVPEKKPYKSPYKIKKKPQ
ncbi:MAG: sulfatase [Deltaproteobacteria bacterium]|nr:sulfatase [Deltaproteobacteria bacterium]